MLPAFLLILALTAPRAHGATAAASSVDEFAGELQAYSRKLEALPPPSAACTAPYAKVEVKNPLTIGVFFGFIDTGRKNYVADGDFKQALIRRLTRGCAGTLQACGFAAAAGEPTAPNETRLRKSQSGRNVVIDVYDSSVGGDYAAAVGRLSAEQEARSRLAEDQYLAAMNQDAVVLYAGHTRRFSGTGFHPPLALTRSSAATFLRRPFYLRVYDALRRSASPPAVMGLFACFSSESDAGRIHALAPGTALIVTSQSSPHENNLLGMFGAINMVLARPCFSEAEKSVNAGDAPVFHVYGLFGQAPHARYTRDLDGRLVLIGLLIIPFLVLRVSERTPSAAAAWPFGPSHGAWRGAALMMLLMIPCTFVARTFADESTALPILLALLGAVSLAIAAGTGRISWARLAAATRRAWPALPLFVILYFCANLAREAGVDNAVSALRQAATFTAVFFLIWPFALFSEEVLLAPFVGEDSPGFIASCVQTLVFYLALWLSLCALAPVYKPRLWPVAALALYIRASSFLLYRRKPRVLIPALCLAMTLALLITEGIHVLIYN